MCKYLWDKGFDCNLLPWNRKFHTQELAEFEDCYDLLVTTPTAWTYLKNNLNYNPSKIVMVAHGEKDLKDFLEGSRQEEFELFYQYAVVSNWLKDKSKELGIDKIPKVINLGINTRRYDQPISQRLETVGYAGTFNVRHPSEVKRPHLIQIAVEKAGLKLKIAEHVNYSFVTMPGFYNSVDAIMLASQMEGAGLPMLEAGAAGRLVISTPVGHWNEKVTDKGGIALPMDENLYIEKAVDVLTFYKNNPEAYRKKCQEIKDHSDSYDWRHVIDNWVDLLS